MCKRVAITVWSDSSLYCQFQCWKRRWGSQVTREMMTAKRKVKNGILRRCKPERSSSSFSMTSTQWKRLLNSPTRVQSNILLCDRPQWFWSQCKDLFVNTVVIQWWSHSRLTQDTEFQYCMVGNLTNRKLWLLCIFLSRANEMNRNFYYMQENAFCICEDCNAHRCQN